LKARQSEKDSESDKFSRNALLLKLPVLLEDNDVDVKRCTLSIVGSLSMDDWEWIHSGNSDDIFHRVVSYCLEYSGPAHHNLRCDACKALGNIISVILAAIVTPDNRYSTSLGMIEDSIIVSVSSLNDSQADVRGMALFTIGNVASAISTLSLDLKFKETLLSILESVAYRLDDENEKVRSLRFVSKVFLIKEKLKSLNPFFGKGCCECHTNRGSFISCPCLFLDTKSGGATTGSSVVYRHQPKACCTHRGILSRYVHQ
jgi:hypothetical protein